MAKLANFLSFIAPGRAPGSVLVHALLLASLLLPPAAHAQSASRLERIKAARAITIAFAEDAAPFSFREGGQPAGYSVDLCQRVVAGIKAQLKLDELKINWVGASTPERLKLVAAGKADLECGITTHTLRRQEQVEFSLPVFIDGGGILVPKGSPIVGLPGLDGRKIAAVRGTTTAGHLEAALKKRSASAQIVPAENRAAAMAMLDRGEVDAYAGDRGVLIGQAMTTKTRTPEWTLLDLQFSYEPYAFAMPRDPELRLAVNRALAGIYRSRQIEDIYGRWLGRFGKPQPLVQAMFVLNQIPE
jgi:polar amino acid transport system substrate-binding protein/glutamate/aspartate transport system substrate-binding protein